MEFTKEEKKACLYVLMALASCDGPRNEKELDMLVRCGDVLGVTLDEMLGGMADYAARMSLSTVETIIKPMDNSKKLVLESCMRKMVEADGPTNDTERGAWWTIEMTCDLPTWVSRKQ